MKHLIKAAGVAAATITLTMVTSGSATAAIVEGTRGADNLVGTSSMDRIRGYEGADRLAGLAGFDREKAHQGNDTLFGGNGADMLYPGMGRDHVYGGNGVDTVIMRFDRQNNIIYCGPGRDAIFFVRRAFDRDDKIISCEDVYRVDSV